MVHLKGTVAVVVVVVREASMLTLFFLRTGLHVYICTFNHNSFDRQLDSSAAMAAAKFPKRGET